jgi:hypothetical protein
MLALDLGSRLACLPLVREAGEQAKKEAASASAGTSNEAA